MMKLLEPKANPIGIILASLAKGRVGITPAFGQSISEAAAVCLDEQGHSSPTNMAISGQYDISAIVEWMSPSDQANAVGMMINMLQNMVHIASLVLLLNSVDLR